MPHSAAQLISSGAPTRVPESAQKRLVSLDAFRGLTIALMVLVNNNGSGRDAYFQLRHSEWHGWTLTDTVFPTFLWIVGLAIALSLGKRVAQGVPKRTLIAQVCRRSAVLFVLGMLCYAFPHFNLGTQRILGVLQRIAICYFVVSLVYLYTGIRGQICCVLGLLAVYWALMTFAPVPGYGAGRLDVEGNFAHYVDHLILGSHNYRPTRDWDPEGIVSTLPAIATTLLGVLAGYILRSRRKLLLAGCALLAAGAIWSHWMPINKKIWTDSFCLFMAGLDFLVYAAFAWLVDELGWRTPVKPFAILGMNAITIYMISEFAAEALYAFGLQHPIYHTIFVPIASPANASLLYSLAFTGAMYVIAYVMYRRRWFIKV